MRHKDRLPFTDRSFLEATNAYGRGDYDTAIEVYRRLLDRYPDSYRALNNLALVYQDRRAVRDGGEPVHSGRTDRLDDREPLLRDRGEPAAAGEVRRGAPHARPRWRAGFPDNPILLNIEVQLASAQHRWEEAERRAEALIAASAGDTLALVDPFEALALMATTQGRLEEADRLWRTHQRLSAASGSMGRHLFGVVRRAGIDLRYRELPGARARDPRFGTGPYSARQPAPGGSPVRRARAIQRDRLGRLDRARQLAEAADANDRALERQQVAERGVDARRDRAGRRTRLRRRCERLRTAAEQHLCTICVLPDLARAYEADGKARAATTVYERYVATPWFWRYETDALELGPSLERLAALYEAAGERGKAQGARTRLVQLWRRADAELQPVVTRARSGVGAER